MHPLYVWPKAKQQKKPAKKETENGQRKRLRNEQQMPKKPWGQVINQFYLSLSGELHRPAPISFSIPISISVYLFFLNEFGELISKLT